MINFQFPEDFLWGTATAAFQIEGAAAEDGRGPSIWDCAALHKPEKFHDGATPAVAADFYHHFKQDIVDMKELGLKSFRCSISWSRIFPAGFGAVNRKGVDFYKRLFDTLLENDIEPFVDLYHWDLPQALADDGGFKNSKIITHFGDFAERCFLEFGDKVKLWSTVNEPSVMAFTSHAHGAFPPYETRLDSALLAAHNILKMHYEAIRRFRAMNLNDGEIGAVIAMVPIYPATKSEDDILAAVTQQDYIVNWWLAPMFEGTYPKSVLKHAEVANVMPHNFADELKLAFQPIDFIGLNYYYPYTVKYKPDTFLCSKPVENYYAQSDYFTVYPQGMFDAMLYVKNRFNNPAIYITENGLGQNVEKHADIDNDDERIRYIREHLREAHRAIQAGADIRGYYYWSNMDTFEGPSGYKIRFGLVGIDYKTLKRTKRKSWHFYRECIASNSIY